MVAVCDAAAEYAIAVNGARREKVRVIRNGVELPAEAIGQRRSEVRSALGVDGDEVVFGCVANFVRDKRHALLLDAFAIVAADHPAVRLVLVGDGPLREAITRQVADLGLDAKVQIHGQDPEPLGLYPAFDVVVQASLREGLSNVLLEAAASRKAIVATDAGGTAEVVTDGRTGLLVPTEDAAAFAAAMRAAADDPLLRARLGAEAHALVSERYGMDRFVAEWGAFYEWVAEERGVQR